MVTTLTLEQRLLDGVAAGRVSFLLRAYLAGRQPGRARCACQAAHVDGHGGNAAYPDPSAEKAIKAFRIYCGWSMPNRSLLLSASALPTLRLAWAIRSRPILAAPFGAGMAFHQRSGGEQCAGHDNRIVCLAAFRLSNFATLALPVSRASGALP